MAVKQLKIKKFHPYRNRPNSCAPPRQQMPLTGTEGLEKKGRDKSSEAIIMMTIQLKSINLNLGPELKQLKGRNNNTIIIAHPFAFSLKDQFS